MPTVSMFAWVGACRRSQCAGLASREPVTLLSGPLTATPPSRARPVKHISTAAPAAAAAAAVIDAMAGKYCVTATETR